MTIILAGGTLLSQAQSQQEVKVTIEGYKFHTSQMSIQLHADTIIRVKNLDNVRHDFGSQMFLNTLTQVESDGVVTYGKGVRGFCRTWEGSLVSINDGSSGTFQTSMFHSSRHERRGSLAYY